MIQRANLFVKVCTAVALVAVCVVPQSLMAETGGQLVTPQELQKATVDASQQRQQNQQTLERLFNSSEAQKALETSHMNPTQVKKAVAGLNDTELAQLAQRATNAQKDFAAGEIDNRDLLLIVVAIAALILIIVAVR